MMTFIIGMTAGTICTISFIPQILQIIRTKHTKDISLTMYSVFSLGVFLWLIYGILAHQLPVIIANAVSFLFLLTILGMKIKYG
jgi:MtN3 and saliva related transmembrane protein